MSAVIDIVKDVIDEVVDIVEDVVGAIGDAIDWAVDEIIKPVVDGVGDIIQAALDDPITTIAKVAAIATGNAWALPLIDGASTVAKGGDISDALKAAAVSYATGKIGATTAKFVNPEIAKAGFNSTVEVAIQQGVQGGVKAASVAVVYGQDPLKAFATGGLNAAVGATLGQVADKIDTKFENFTGGIDVEGNAIVGGWEKLQDGIKDSITASLTAELTGGDVSAEQLLGIVGKYSGVSETMSKFLSENTGLDDATAVVMTSALTNAATAALAGNPELSSDAFFAKWDEYGMSALKDIVDKPVNAAIDKVTGSSKKTEAAALALNSAVAKAVAGKEGFNALYEQKTALYGKYEDEVQALKDLQGASNPTIAQVDAIKARITTAANAYNQWSAANDPVMETFRTEYDTYTAQLDGLTDAYNQETQYLMSDIDDLNVSMKPVYDEITLAAALAIRPNFDAEAYAAFTGTNPENVAADFLLNGQNGPASKPEIKTTLDAVRLATVQSALASKGITLESLKPEQLAAYLAYADKEITSIASITGLDTDKFANTMVTDAALTPALTTALKNSGFIPQSTDDYKIFLAGEYLKLNVKDPDGSNVFVDTTGMSSADIKTLLAENDLSTSNIVNVGDGFYNRIDDMAFDYPSIDAVNEAVFSYGDDLQDAAALKPVGFGIDVEVADLLNGNAVLVNDDGELYWKLKEQQQEALGTDTDVNSVVNTANSDLSVIEIASDALYAPLEWREVPSGFSYLSADGMTAYTSDYAEDANGNIISGISSKQLPPASGLISSTVAGMTDAQGADFDEATGGTLWETYNKIKNTLEGNDAAGNAASIITGASGEMLQAISGLATLVGANPNNSIGQTAKSLLALSGDLRSDSWVAGAEDMATRSQDYDKDWRAANPGKEPSTAQKGWLKAQSIFGNLIEHPVQFLAENVAGEILQELPILLVSGGVGNVAKAALLKGGEAYAKKIATRAAMGSALAIDSAEAFGGTAAGAFDETYANAIAQGMSEKDATDIAMDTAQKAGTIALFTTAITAGIGGQALAKSVLGDNASEFAGTAFQTLGKKITDGTTVTIKEGVTEFIEEALPQLFTATVNSQIDPNYDVAGSVFENGFLGSISGVGVGATLYSGNAVADALTSINSTVVDTIKNAGSAEAATTALNNLGITDTAVLNNVLNSTYDTLYVSTNEAAKIFEDAQPGFVPTDAEIESFVSKRPESDVATAVASYIDPKFLDVDEVKAAALTEGVTLTDEQAAKYVKQTDEAAAVATIKTEYDPQGTSRDDAVAGFQRQNGYTPTDAELNQFVGATPDSELDELLFGYVNPRQTTEAEARKFFTDQGYEPTNAEIQQFVGQGGADFATTTKSGVDTYVDPRQVTDEEARQFFADLGYSNPTDEQVAQFVAQVEETTQQDVISKYVDPRQVTRAEVQAIADQEGLTLTDALAATYVGQGEAETFQTDTLNTARTEYDPLATTLDEATQFFADTNYTATAEEIAEFVASKTEEVQTSAIGAYVDPRQMTSDEAREFLSEIGYNPTDQEVADFTGQLNDDSYQTTQKTAIDKYVDPRFFDAGEVRAAYEELGLVDVTQEDVDRFVGQYDPDTGADAEGFESARLEELRTYIPTATFNVIKQILGSPAVEDDPNTDADESKNATGIYAEFEAGATRDEALQAAIDKVAKDLGTTKEDLLEELGLTEERLNEEIDAVVDEVDELAGVIGTEGVEEVVDSEGNVVTEGADPTGLFATIKAYEDAGIARDEAVRLAIDEVSTALGTTKTDLLTAIGETETTLTGKIDTATETLGADIDAVADLVGKPATEVTQTDIDFVIDLIAQENVSAELITQYDVTGDGIIDINDQTLLETALQGDEDVTLADTSMFNPATGLYLQQEQDTETTMDAITDMNTNINTNIQTNAQQAALRDLVSLEQQGAFKGAKTTVSSADPMNIDYLYDFNSVFANPSQEGLFASPYSTTTRNKPANNSMGPTPMASGFAKGGQVEDENDMLLRLLGEI